MSMIIQKHPIVGCPALEVLNICDRCVMMTTMMMIMRLTTLLLLLLLLLLMMILMTMMMMMMIVVAMINIEERLDSRQCKGIMSNS